MLHHVSPIKAKTYYPKRVVFSCRYTFFVKEGKEMPPKLYIWEGSCRKETLNLLWICIFWELPQILFHVQLGSNFKMLQSLYLEPFWLWPYDNPMAWIGEIQLQKRTLFLAGISRVLTADYKEMNCSKGGKFTKGSYIIISFLQLPSHIIYF